MTIVDNRIKIVGYLKEHTCWMMPKLDEKAFFENPKEYVERWANAMVLKAVMSQMHIVYYIEGRLYSKCPCEEGLFQTRESDIERIHEGS